MSLTKINENKKGIISALSDQPALTANQLKGKFDEASDEIIEYINNTLISELESELENKQEMINFSLGEKVLISNSDGKIEESVISADKLGYLVGVTGDIQTQLNGKQGTVTLGANKIVATDSNGKLIVTSIASNCLRAITYGTSEPDNADGMPEGSIYLKVVE